LRKFGVISSGHILIPKDVAAPRTASFEVSPRQIPFPFGADPLSRKITEGAVRLGNDERSDGSFGYTAASTGSSGEVLHDSKESKNVQRLFGYFVHP
jgi:hypothetical protein